MIIWQLTIQANAFDASSISEKLSLLDPLAVSLEDARDDPRYAVENESLPLWEHTIVKALFEEEISPDKIISFFKENLSAINPNSLIIDIIPIENNPSLTSWQAHFTPINIADKLWVCLPNLKTPFSLEHTLLINPGSAFGTGTHPTTRLCLEWIATHSLAQKTLIDYGCGSGILGLAALKFNAKHVYLTDCDNLALDNARDNIQLNSIDKNKISIENSENFNIPSPVDIIIANILAEPLIELAPLFNRFLLPQGVLVLSGILSSQVDLILLNYAIVFEQFSIKQEAEWVCITAIKKPL
ncbi:MAG: ribosomal protein methyltransferase [Francisellaceae bacterium]|nr:ribosomal protein methyltransferase [Francisellaceae bacterium]